MSKQPKYIQIAGILEKRILHGDYVLTEFPTERSLAREMDVSHLTARKAFQLLEEKELIVKKDNGRPGVPDRGDGLSREMHVAFMMPAASSNVYDELLHAAQKASMSMPLTIRPLYFVHWDDPVIANTIDSYDAVFFSPMQDLPPESFLRLVHDSNKPFVILGNDYSEEGIPSFFPYRHEFIQDLLDYMAELGHKSIDCLNTSFLSPIGYKGIEQWKIWLKKNNALGELISEPSSVYGDAGFAAYNLITNMVREGRFESTALLCSTCRTAIGAIRAMHENGLTVGVDVSVAAMSGGGLASLLTPALTALEACDPEPYLKDILQWMLAGNKKWTGPMLVSPEELKLVKGETVGPPKKTLAR